DGIRDLIVTGVQTCALPISLSPRAGLPRTARPTPVCHSGRGSALSDSATQASCRGVPRYAGQLVSWRGGPSFAGGTYDEAHAIEIGRASCRERVEDAGGAGW